MRQVAGVVLEGDDILLAAVLARLGVAYLQHRNGTAPAAAVRVRDQLAAFAAAETAAVLARAGRETAKLPAARILAESSPAEMTVQAAAGLLAISPQAVRGLCRTGQLLATRSPAGHWRIDTDTVAALAARRKECNGTTTIPL